MLQRPRLKPHLRSERIEGRGVFILSELQQLVLQGRLYELLVDKLDGRPIEAVCQAVAGQASPAQVFYTVNALEKKGLLCEDADLVPGEAMWSLQGIEPATARGRLSQTTVAVEGLGVDASPLCDLLATMGLTVAREDAGQAGVFRVVVTDNYLHRGLAAVNRQALESGRPWLLVKPTGAAVWLGPMFEPGKTGCWECLAQRMRANFPVLGLLESLLDDRPLPSIDVTQTRATLAAAWGLASTAVAQAVAGGGSLPHLSGKMQSLDLVGLRVQTHALLAQPLCAACGRADRPARREARPLVLRARRKTYTDDGGHRAASPEETLKTYGHHVSPICGAVSMLERSAPSDDGVMHVYYSGNNIARGPQSVFNLKVDLRNQSCGKGINEAQAKASALCEGLERYCGIFRGDEPRCRGRFDQLEGAVHPNACMLFSDRQYAEREERNQRAGAYDFIPLPFDPQAEIEWTPVWSLSKQAFRHLPTEFCHFSYPHECDKNFCVGCSNGNAAGNSLEEAILQGFFELAERDAVSLWWYNRIRLPAIDLDSFREPYLDRLRAYFQTRHRVLWALDLTNDLGIPAVAALSRRTDGPQEHIMFGFGAHFDARIALLRAVTELNQMLVPIIEASPGGPIPRLNDEATLNWVETATLENQPYLMPVDGPPRAASSFPRDWTDDIKDDIDRCRARVESLGLEMLVLDQTRPEIGMPVVKVIVPGLRHFWTRFAPGRLYDAPVKLGWLKRPLGEDELNPVPMFL
jgi:ribosomal protein S12 methylthiotransferase accessory factor